MGTGNKLDPFAFRIADISKTDTCPLAKVMRRELRARGIHHMKVLFSKELPRKPIALEGSAQENRGGKISPASIATIPSVAGLMIANEILRDLGAVTP
jgi:tRNA A37 threonylcarbamoyladenosine dehydratase